MVVVQNICHANRATSASDTTIPTYRTNPRPNVRVLINLDESTYQGGNMGDHPIAWYHAQGSGRSFYTGFGHTIASYADAAFRQHLLGGIQYAAGAASTGGDFAGRG